MSKTGTDLVKHLGELAFATRLKRLSESLFTDCFVVKSGCFGNCNGSWRRYRVYLVYITDKNFEKFIRV